MHNMVLGWNLSWCCNYHRNARILHLVATMSACHKWWYKVWKTLEESGTTERRGKEWVTLIYIFLWDCVGVRIRCEYSQVNCQNWIFESTKLYHRFWSQGTFSMHIVVTFPRWSSMSLSGECKNRWRMYLASFPGSSALEREIEFIHAERAWYLFSREKHQR